MKRFELTLVVRNESKDFECQSIDKVEHDNLVGLLAQFLIVIVGLQRRLEKKDIFDDDIPF